MGFSIPSSATWGNPRLEVASNHGASGYVNRRVRFIDPLRIALDDDIGAEIVVTHDAQPTAFCERGRA